MERSMKLFGILYLVLAILNIFNSFYYQNQGNIFWFCSIGIFLIGAGIILQNKAILQSQLCILFIPDVIWTLDFLYFLVNGSSIFGIVDYFFAAGPSLQKAVSLQHVLTVPLILYLAGQHKFEKNKIWIISCVQWALFFLLSRTLTIKEANINCTYHFCGDNFLSIPSEIYPLIWLITGFVMIYITQLIIVNISRKWYTKKSKKITK